MKNRNAILATLIGCLTIVGFMTETAMGQGVGNRGPEWQRHVIDVGLSGADGGRLLDVDADGDLDLQSENDTIVLSASGAAAFAKQSENAAGLAGAFSLNVLNMTTQSFVDGANVQQVDDVLLQAIYDRSLIAISAGIAGIGAITIVGNLLGEGNQLVPGFGNFVAGGLKLSFGIPDQALAVVAMPHTGRLAFHHRHIEPGLVVLLLQPIFRNEGGGVNHFTLANERGQQTRLWEVCDVRCVTGIYPDSPKLLPVRESYATGMPVRWIRVHDLPDYAYFNHSAHVTRGVGCVECHGRVDKMEVVYQAEPLSMGWCLDCHRNPEPHLRPVEHVTRLDWVPSEDPEELGRTLRQRYDIDPSTDCSICHR